MESQRDSVTLYNQQYDDAKFNSSMVDEDAFSVQYSLGDDTTVGYRQYKDDDGGIENLTWKDARPSFARSLLYCMLCAFSTTVICGIPGGMITLVLTWLDLRIAEACYNTAWNLIPVTIQRYRLTAQVVEGMFIQFWSFCAICMMCGWKKTSQLNIPIWNVFGASCDAIYRLFLHTYGVYNQTWKSYPLNVIFVALTCFNFYRISAAFENDTRLRIKIALKFGMPFLLGTPMFLLMNYLLFPAYAKIPSDTSKAVFSVLLPAAFIIPKAVINVCLVDLHEFCSPSHTSHIVIGFHTMTAIVPRYLQASIEEMYVFVIICFVHGFETLLDKLTLNLRLKAYHTFCKSCVGDREGNRRRSVAMNRILSEQALSGMILETDTIFMSCGLISVLSYYFGKDTPNMTELAKSFAIRVTLASLIEFLFNVASIKVQTYYFNLPLLHVWRKRWWWVMLSIILYTAYTTLYCSEYLYRPILSQSVYNLSKVAACSVDSSIL